jgi:hypothetical protein
MVSIVFLCEQLAFSAISQTCIEHYPAFQFERVWAGRYQPTAENPGLAKKNYTDHVPLLHNQLLKAVGYGNIYVVILH